VRCVQVVSKHRNIDLSSFGNVQFRVHPPGGTNNWFREGYDVVFISYARHLYSNGVDSQGFLRMNRMNFALA